MLVHLPPAIIEAVHLGCRSIRRRQIRFAIGLWICIDEKPITLHADLRPASPAIPGREARRDNEYERCGTANVFCAVEPKAGRHFTFATPDRSGFEFARVAVTLAMAYPEAETIHLVLDNLNIHRRKALADAFGAEMAPRSGIASPSTTRPLTAAG